MQYINSYQSPLGKIILAADEVGLTGLYFESQKDYAANLDPEHKSGDLPIFDDAKRWLDIYFEGREPEFTPQLNISGSDFRVAVLKHLLKIPYGKTTTYNELAKSINTSARAVGGAVGHNPISIIIPCHRVIGSDGRLIGYAGGIDKKKQLLILEKANLM